jgi:hypothetical protein
MKRFALVCVLLSTTAFAKIDVITGRLSKNLPANTQILQLQTKTKDIQIKRSKLARAINVTLNLVAENETEIHSYTNQWELRVSPVKNGQHISIAPSGISAYDFCEAKKSKGAYTKLEGVCQDSITVTIPEKSNLKVLPVP